MCVYIYVDIYTDICAYISLLKITRLRIILHTHTHTHTHSVGSSPWGCKTVRHNLATKQQTTIYMCVCIYIYIYITHINAHVCA